MKSVKECKKIRVKEKQNVGEGDKQYWKERRKNEREATVKWRAQERERVGCSGMEGASAFNACYRNKTAGYKMFKSTGIMTVVRVENFRQSVNNFRLSGLGGVKVSENTLLGQGKRY